MEDGQEENLEPVCFFIAIGRDDILKERIIGITCLI